MWRSPVTLAAGGALVFLLFGLKPGTHNGQLTRLLLLAGIGLVWLGWHHCRAGLERWPLPGLLQSRLALARSLLRYWLVLVWWRKPNGGSLISCGPT